MPNLTNTPPTRETPSSTPTPHGASSETRSERTGRTTNSEARDIIVSRDDKDKD